MFRTTATNILEGALTSRPYRPTASIVSRAFAAPASSFNFESNPCLEADTSIIKDDSFDFWAHREKVEAEREKALEKEQNSLFEKYSPKSDSPSFDNYLRIALSKPGFRETVAKICEDFDSYSPYHFQAVAEREALRGEHLNVRTVHLMMLAGDFNLNEQDYTILFRSYWKNGTVAHLVSLLKEMNLFGLNPTQSMIQIATQAAKAAKDSKAEKEIKSVSTNLSDPKDLSHAAKTDKAYKRMLAKTDLIREVLDKDTPAGDFFFCLFGTHKNYS
jgi:hypothetical protein